jgi:hypothetical protein
MDDNVITKSIKIMDNWQYENVVEIKSNQEVEQFILLTQNM